MSKKNKQKAMLTQEESQIQYFKISSVTEYVENRFKNMTTFYPPYKEKDLKLKVGEFVKSLSMVPNNLQNLKPFPYLNLSKVDNQYLSQDKLEALYSNMNNENDLAPLDSITNLPYVSIHFYRRHQMFEYEALLSHSIIEFTLLDNMSLPIMFDSMEEDLMDAHFVAGNVGSTKRAFLSSKLDDGEYYYFELADFFMLALIDKDEDKETGAITIFNRKLGILYNEIIEGYPTLKSAKLPFKNPTQSGDNDESQPTPDPIVEDSLSTNSTNPNQSALTDLDNTDKDEVQPVLTTDTDSTET